MPEKKITNPIVFIAIGCVALLVLLGIGSTLFFKFFAKNAIQSAIEGKTGIKTNISDLEEGKMTFTDTKTGAKVDIGSGEVPANFPKDFPLYPGAKVTSSLTGEQTGKSNGFWLTMTTGDSVDKVNDFYKRELAAKGWAIKGTFSAGDTSTQTVTKGDWGGTLGITKGDNETQIVIMIGQEEN